MLKNVKKISSIEMHNELQQELWDFKSVTNGRPLLLNSMTSVQKPAHSKLTPTPSAHCAPDGSHQLFHEKLSQWHSLCPSVSVLLLFAPWHVCLGMGRGRHEACYGQCQVYSRSCVLSSCYSLLVF